MRNKIFRLTDRTLARRYYRETTRPIKNFSRKCKRLVEILTQGRELYMMIHIIETALSVVGCLCAMVYLEQYTAILDVVLFLIIILNVLSGYICNKAFDKY